MRLIDNAIRSAILPPDTLAGYGGDGTASAAGRPAYEAKRQIPLNF
jgi:hypothetical protein